MIALVAGLTLTRNQPIGSSWSTSLLIVAGGFTAVHVVVAIALDRAWHDLTFLYLLPVVTIYSVFMSLVTARALWLEVCNSPKQWNKLVRVGPAGHRRSTA
jgi:poly-beta-1,6-N-acetyl-D-glucosamine synthase